MRMFRLWCMALCLVFAGAPFASAHRVNIFAFVDGDAVQVECGFNRSQKVKQGTVEVFDATTGAQLLQGTTDDNGVFRFPVTAELREAGHDLNIRIIAGEGHQNQWKLSKEDFSLGADSKTAVSTVKLEILNKEAETNTASPKIYSQEELDATLKTAREQTEMQVIAPLRKQLAEAQQPKITWRDIVGGLGWCLGLGGLFAWISTRRQKNK